MLNDVTYKSKLTPHPAYGMQRYKLILLLQPLSFQRLGVGDGGAYRKTEPNATSTACERGNGIELKHEPLNNAVFC